MGVPEDLPGDIVHTVQIVVTAADLVTDWIEPGNAIADLVDDFTNVVDPSGDTILPTVSVVRDGTPTAAVGYNATSGGVDWEVNGTGFMIESSNFSEVFTAPGSKEKLTLTAIGPTRGVPVPYAEEVTGGPQGIPAVAAGFEIAGRSAIHGVISSKGVREDLSPFFLGFVGLSGVKTSANDGLINVSGSVSAPSSNRPSLIAVFIDWHLASVTTAAAGTFEVPIPNPQINGSFQLDLIAYSNQSLGSALVLTLENYQVTLGETGLSSGTNWSASIGNISLSSTGPTITLNFTNGTLSYSVGAVEGYLVNPTGGPIVVNGTSVNLPITFSRITMSSYSVTFVETGLPTGHGWSVTVAKVGKLSTSTKKLEFPTLPNGTYSYRIAVAYPQDSYKTTFSGAVTVKGASVRVDVVFTQAQYKVTFQATGLTAGTEWTVLAGSGPKTVSGIGMNLSMTLPNGTFSWSAEATGYDSPSGSVIVSGATVSVSVTFAPSAGGTPAPIRQ
jgi:hypothetical protein